MAGDRSNLGRSLLLGGGAASAAVLIAALFRPGAALTGWLGAVIAFTSVPAGALLLLMMMRLIPGAWGEQLRLSAEAATLLGPMAAVAFLPILLGLGAIYSWDHMTNPSGFAAAWLGPLQFACRSALRFALLIWIGARMRTRRSTARTAAAGLVVMPVLAFLAAMDWLMSLDPRFASSAFGLQYMIREVTIAFAALLLLRLRMGRTPPRLNVAGGLLLTLLLLWAYLQFMPFFVAWSTNMPESAAWYLERGRGGWGALAWLWAALGGVPLLILLFPRPRRDPRWLAGLAAAVLLGQLLELGWVLLPGRPAGAELAFAVALTGMLALAAGLLPEALRRRIAARTSNGKRP